MENTLTKGKIYTALIKFSLPLIFASVLQQLYSWVDAFIVGNMLGENYLAAVGATGVFNFFIISVITGFATGITIIVSEYFGAKNLQNIRKINTTFNILAFIVFTVLGILGYFFSRNILALMNTPADIIDISTEYLAITFIGLPFVACYNVQCSVLRGMSDTKMAMFAIGVSTIMNIILNPIFIKYLHLGVKGVAIATVLSQFVSMGLLVIYTQIKYASCSISLRRTEISLAECKRGMAKGAPIALQASIIALGSMVLQSVMNGFGTTVVNAITTAYRIDTMILAVVTNTAGGIAVIVSQNRGARNPKRAIKGAKAGTIIVLAAAIVTTAVVVIGGEFFMRLFGVSEGVVAIGREFLLLVGIFYAIFGLYNCCLSYLQGEGKVLISSIIAVAAMAVRIILSYTTKAYFGWKIVAFAEIASWIFGCTLAVIVCWIYIRKSPKQSNVNTEKQDAESAEIKIE